MKTLTVTAEITGEGAVSTTVHTSGKVTPVETAMAIAAIRIAAQDAIDALDVRLDERGTLKALAAEFEVNVDSKVRETRIAVVDSDDQTQEKKT